MHLSSLKKIAAKPWRSVLLGLAVGVSLIAGFCLIQRNSIPMLGSGTIVFQNTKERGFYQKILAQSEDLKQITPEQGVWGVVVPHHLLAADVIARTLKQLAAQDVRLIYLISPDHYSHGQTLFTIADQKLQTPVETSQSSPKILQELLQFPEVRTDNSIFSIEHGIGSVLPFAQLLWPQARIVPILVRSDAKEEDTAPLWNFLRTQIADPQTLIIESSDFSHYLSPEAAKVKDQETIQALLGNDPQKILSLGQPENCDSLLPLYINKSIAQETRGQLEIFMNRNSQFYTNEKVASSTSYLTMFFSRKKLEIVEPERELLFGGDFFTGRYNLKNMRTENFRTAVVNEFQKITKGRSVIVNFEGFLREDCSEATEKTLCMEIAPTLDLMKRLNIKGVSLANNHSRDGGSVEYERTRAILNAEQIAVFADGERTDFRLPQENISILALTDIDPSTKARGALYQEKLQSLLAKFVAAKSETLKILFLHWGEEYATKPTARETKIYEQIQIFPIPVIIGSHTHVGSELRYENGRVFQFSLGNFLFDQPENVHTGKVLRLKILETGNIATELLEL